MAKAGAVAAIAPHSGSISRAPTCRRLKPMMMPDQTFLKGDKQRPTERFLLTA
jgi:hypothetical protein